MDDPSKDNRLVDVPTQSTVSAHHSPVQEVPPASSLQRDPPIENNPSDSGPSAHEVHLHGSPDQDTLPVQEHIQLRELPSPHIAVSLKEEEEPPKAKEILAQHTPSTAKTSNEVVSLVRSSSSTSGIERTPSLIPAKHQQSLLTNHPIGHFKFHLADRVEYPIDNTQVSTIGTLLNQLSSKPPQVSGLEIFFLPPIHVEEREAGSSALLDDPLICKELAKHLRLDPLFLTEEAWNSNGFLMSQQGWGSRGFDAYSYMTRFLIKFLQDPKAKGTSEYPSYSWLFLAFSILWFQGAGGDVSCVLVCFDDSFEIKQQILQAFKGYPTENIRESPFAIYDALLRSIVMQYDKALWLFRAPIRKIEKDRKLFADKIPNLLNQKSIERGGVMDDYVRMHELSRHAIHMSETLQVATKTVDSTLHHVDSHASILHGPDPQRARSGGGVMNTIAGLQFSAGLLANLKLRADAFVDRLDNEIQLAYNIVSVYQLQDTQRLLQESREEEKDLVTVVGQLTLVFLPATFVTGCWGMNFSSTDGTRIRVAWRDTWQFFVSSVGAIILCIVLYRVLINRRRSRRTLSGRLDIS